MRRGTWANFCTASLIKQEKSDNPEWANPYSAESRKLQKSVKQNDKKRAPLNRIWGHSLSNRPYAAPLRPHQGQLDSQMVDGEGGGAGACRAIFSGGEEGESSDQRIHRVSQRSTKHGTLCHQEDGAYHIRKT